VQEKRDSKSQLRLGVCSTAFVVIFWVVMFAIWHHFAGPEHPLSADEPERVVQKQITLHSWLFPALFGFGSFLFSCLILSFYNMLNRGMEASIPPEEREYFQQQQRVAARKAAVSAGMGVLLLAFMYYQNYSGCGLFLLVNCVLSFFGWEYWE
jgi:hypothetical protein